MSRDVIGSQKVMETHQLWGHFACCFTTHPACYQAWFISATFSFQTLYLLDFAMTTLNESATKRNKHTAFRIEKCKWPYCNWFSFWIGFVEKVAWFSGPFTRSPFDRSNFFCLSSILRILGLQNDKMDNRCRVVLERARLRDLQSKQRWSEFLLFFLEI